MTDHAKRWSVPPERLLFAGRRIAFDQVPNALEDLRLIDDVKQPAPSILATLAVWSRERALLIHISEDGASVRAGGDTDLGVIALRLWNPLEAERSSLPRSRRGVCDGARSAQRSVPTRGFRGGGGRRNLRCGGPRGGTQRLADQQCGNHLPWRDVQIRGLRNQHDAAG